MELFDKVKQLLEQEHDSEIKDSKVMLHLMMDEETHDGVVMANGSEIQLASLICSFLYFNKDVLHLVEKFIGTDNESKVL